jgi:hypothetical protein
MPISGPQQEKLSEWLRTKGVRRECPACGAGKLAPGDVIAPPAAPGGGGTVIGGPSFPLVQLVCENCAHVIHFACTPIGLDL